MRRRAAADAGGRSVDLRLLVHLWPYVKPHKRAFLWAFLLLTISAVVKLAGPYALKLAIDGPMTRGDFSGLLPFAALYLFAQLAEALLDGSHTLLVRTRGQDILRSLRSALFEKMQRLPNAHFDTTPSGRILARITSDVGTLADLFSSGLIVLFGDLLLLLGVLVALFRLDVRLALTASAVIPVLVAVTEAFRRWMRDAYRRVREKTARLTGRIQEFLRGYEVVRLFGAESWAEAEVETANREHRDAFLRSVTLYSLFFPTVELISSLALALVLWKGGVAVSDRGLTLGALVAFLEYLQKFFRPVRDLSEKYSVLQASMASVERISEFLDQPEESPRPEASEPVPVTGEILFDRVSFAYDHGPPVLKGVSFRVAPGEVVALVGPTGAGKTTLIHLLLGAYRLGGGKVLVDGVEVTCPPPEAFRRQVALVPQDVFLFDDSILENIRLGRPWVSREDAVAAARAVGLHDAVTNLPRGYDARVLEEGARLSSGQRQLVAFARALAGDPRILVLDEATSEVDQATEALIEHALLRLFSGRSSVVVAHRLATVRRADRIVVLSKGQVVEEGSHEELLGLGGAYRRLYELQFRGSGRNFPQLEGLLCRWEKGARADPGLDS